MAKRIVMEAFTEDEKVELGQVETEKKIRDIVAEHLKGFEKVETTILADSVRIEVLGGSSVDEEVANEIINDIKKELAFDINSEVTSSNVKIEGVVFVQTVILITAKDKKLEKEKVVEALIRNKRR
jgi:predicted Mrr-cat superfamily restriction endonuclease